MTTSLRPLIFALALPCCRSTEQAAPTPPQVARLEPSPSPVSATEVLDRMDPRSPVPLLPAMASHQKQNMRDHLVAVQEVVSALSIADYAGVEAAAARIGFSQAMGQMCSHMGAGAPGFAEQAIEFHHTADRIAIAARARDGAAVMVALGSTLQGCTSCHAVWKQQVVDEPTWQRLASSSAPAEPRSH
jgi:hypothetical protein